ncbi:hypothetical protein MPF19_03730 [Polaribacter sp. Z014]|uniref:sialidase family protein n=1 Tax=Polaribacter sp. Z014 TaxID=2927126 RepID=UPI0020216455|nr:sialidase family protein [Polaribacter sp. Z014]MCL7762512.1 hypothetical protein [Polaribacter sp. Z014]
MRTKYLLLLLCSLSMGTLISQNKVDFSNMDTKKIHSDKSVVWEQFGPGGSGNNYFIYWHPTDPNVVFQGPNMGNSYASYDKGNTYMGIMDADGPGYSSRGRGPVEIYSPEFSHQDPDFGICGMEDANFIYFTYNRGKDWVRNDKVAKQFKDNHINTFEVDPNDDTIWYAGTGDVRSCNNYFFSHEAPHGYSSSKISSKSLKKRVASMKKYKHDARIWKSTDKGTTWCDISPKGINSANQITKIFVHPGNSKVVFAGTTYGFYKSENGGKKWKLITDSGLDNNIIRSMDMHYDVKTKKVTLFAIDLVKFIPNGKSIKYNGGIFKSTDEGNSWERMNNNMPLKKDMLSSSLIKKSYYKYALAPWFGISEKEARKKYPELPEEMLHSVSMIRVNPKNVNHILVVNNYKSQFTFYGGMLWRSDNGGENWNVTLRNGKNWEGSDKKKWETRNNPTSHNVSWIAQKEWEKRDAYDRKAGACVEFNADGSTIMYQVAKVVCVSNDNGDTWQENDEQRTTKDGDNWVGAGNSNLPGEEIVQDKRIKDSFYLCSGENSVLRTTNDGGNVRPGALAVYKMKIPNEESAVECSTSSMAVDPKDTNILYTLHYREAFAGKMMTSIDHGKNWVPKATLFDPKELGNSVHISIKMNHLRIDPDYPNRFYLVIAKDRINDDGKNSAGTFKEFGVYRSLDGGNNFEIINKGLPLKGNVQKLELDPNNKGVVYVAVNGTKQNKGGLFMLKDGSDTWEKADSPKGMYSVNDFYFSPDKTMYVSGGTWKGKTNEGGVWSSDKANKWKQVFPYRFTNNIRVAEYDSSVLLVSIPSRKASGILNPGVYRSLNKGVTWTKINMGNIQSDRLNDLEIDYTKRGVYYCSTYGAGYYKAVDPKEVAKKK